MWLKDGRLKQQQKEDKMMLFEIDLIDNRVFSPGTPVFATIVIMPKVFQRLDGFYKAFQ